MKVLDFISRWKIHIIYIVLASFLVLGIGPSLFIHIRMLFSTQGLTYVIRNQWWAVLAYTLLFSSFLVFLVRHPLRKREWRKHSLYIAFIIALFSEMFGFPLTLYILSPALRSPAAQKLPQIVFSGAVLGMQYRLEINTFIGLVVSVVAGVLIILGWGQVYKSKGLETGGIYSVIRHPQYLGIMMIVSIWALVWPTLPTLILWPVLIFAYYRLALSEEKKMISSFGDEYLEYRKNVPAFLPFLK